MIRHYVRKGCIFLRFGTPALLFFLGAPQAFAQGVPVSQNEASLPGTGALAIFENPALIWMLIGMFIVLLAINLLIVFFVNPKHFPRKEVFGMTWPIVKTHLWFFIGILIFQQIFVQVPTFVTAAVQTALKLPNDEPISSSINSLVSFVFGIIIQSGYTALVLHFVDRVPARFSDLFSQLSIFWRYIAASILYALLILVGFILLIVPGVYWTLTYSLWPYFMVDKRMGIFESFKMSAQVTKGYKRSLFALYALLFAMNILGLCVFVVGVFVTAPITALAMSYAYRKLTGSLPNTGSVQSAPSSGSGV